MNTDLSFFAFFAAAAAFWTQIRGLIDRVRGLFIQRTTLSGGIALAVADYLFAEARVIRWGDDMVRSDSAWVRPAERVLEVAYETTPSKPVLAFWQRKPLIFQSPEHQQGVSGMPAHSDVVTITRFRGTVDTQALTRAALEWRQKRETTGHRFSVVHISGKDQSRNDGVSLPRTAPPMSIRSGKRYLHWQEDDIGAPRPPQPFEAYALSPTTRAARDDFHRWRQLKTWYQKRGIPWRRGHVLYGPPGSGKTALARALAQEADMPVYAYDLSSLSNEEFRSAWLDMQESAPCMALIEDIDGVFHGRKNISTQRSQHKSSLTFDCLLNALGGIQTADGVFTVITTNHPETLDEALGQPGSDGTTTRPGRMDRSFCLSLPDETARQQILSRITDDCTPDDLAATADMSAAQVTEWAITRALASTWKNYEPI